MYFKQFLTEVRSGDIVAFNKAVSSNEFTAERDDDLDNVEAILDFFYKRGYKKIGKGLYSTALQATDHFIVKVSRSDRSFEQYVKMVRREQNKRIRIHYPTIILEKEVPMNMSRATIKVYFMERLFTIAEVSAEEFIQSHTKKDVGIFAYLAGEFIDSGSAEQAKKMIHVAETLDPSLKFGEPPQHPGYDNVPINAYQQYDAARRSFTSQLKDAADKAGDEPFFQAIDQIHALGFHSLDMHAGNVMVRKPSGQIVITDPVA